jgi:hypothetical protein
VTALDAGLSLALGPRRDRLAFALVESRTHPVPGQEDRRSAAVGGHVRLGGDRRTSLGASVGVGLSDTADDVSVALTLGRSL